MTETNSTANIDQSHRQRTIYKVTLVGSAGNFLLLAFKFIAGFLGHSSAMIADAVHSFSDFITDIIVLVFVKLSNKPQDCDHKYGHGKYETLATAIIGLMLLGVGIAMLVKAVISIIDFFNGELIRQPGMIALIAAALSIVVKEGLYRYTIHYGRRLDSPAVMANAWHHRSDALSSIGTLVGIGGAIILGSKWTVLDPMAAAIVSILIVKVAADLLGQSMGDLLERSLPTEIEQQILDAVNSFPEVSHPHNLRTRRIGPRKAIDIHVRMDGNLTVNRSHEITRQIEHKLRTMFGSETIVNIHVEPAKTN